MPEPLHNCGKELHHSHIWEGGNGRMERWKSGMMEEWKNGTPIPIAIGIIGGNVEVLTEIPALAEEHWKNVDFRCKRQKKAHQWQAFLSII